MLLAETDRRVERNVQQQLEVGVLSGGQLGLRRRCFHGNGDRGRAFLLGRPETSREIHTHDKNQTYGREFFSADSNAQTAGILPRGRVLSGRLDFNITSCGGFQARGDLAHDLVEKFLIRFTVTRIKWGSQIDRLRHQDFRKLNGSGLRRKNRHSPLERFGRCKQFPHCGLVRGALSGSGFVLAFGFDGDGKSRHLAQDAAKTIHPNRPQQCRLWID